MNASINWYGSFSVIVTPFTKNGDIDEKGYREIIDFVINAGAHGIIAAGSTGEFFLLTNDERKQVFEIATDQVNSRVPLLAGVSASRTDDVLELAKFAETTGSDGLMLLPPLYITVDDAEILNFFTTISDTINLPIMIYNGATPNFLSIERVNRLLEVSNIVAIKDSSRDMTQMNDLIRFCGNKISVFVGEEDLLLPSISIGAVGSVAMVPQIVGEMAINLYQTAADGELSKAQELHNKIVRVYDLFRIGSGYVAIKESMKLLGLPGGYSRPPMRPFNQNQIEKLKQIFNDVGLLN